VDAFESFITGLPRPVGVLLTGSFPIVALGGGLAAWVAARRGRSALAVVLAAVALIALAAAVAFLAMATSTR
jgi:hypothetical protein